MAKRSGPVRVDPKEEARRAYRRYRQSLDAEYRHEASRAIVERLMNWNVMGDVRRVMTYLSFNEEVETYALVRRLFAAGKSVAVPYIHQGTTNLIAAEITNLERDLQTGPMGILEPSPDQLRPLDPKAIDVHCVPALAFDEMGFRIGYGKGYYDRFLILRARHSVTVGLAFDVQVADRLPHEFYDIPVDFVATESRLVDCSVARMDLHGQLGLFQQLRSHRPMGQ
jgi:5-formyltetrahydrofolate cyclo-ligase